MYDVLLCGGGSRQGDYREQNGGPSAEHDLNNP